MKTKLKKKDWFGRKKTVKCCGLCAAAWTAAVGAERNGTGAGASDNDPAAVDEDRSADPDHGAQGVAVDGVRLSAAAAVRASLREPEARRCDANMT